MYAAKVVVIVGDGGLYALITWFDSLIIPRRRAMGRPGKRAPPGKSLKVLLLKPAIIGILPIVLIQPDPYSSFFAWLSAYEP